MDPWSSFASSSSPEPASTAAWALGDVIPDWSDTAPAHSRSVLGNGLDVKRAQSSVNDNQPTVEDNENDPWATAVSPPADAFMPIVSPERKPSPQKDVPDVPLTFSGSNPGQAEANIVAMEDEKLHRSLIGEASKYEEHVADIISTQAESSTEQVSHDINSHDINTSPTATDNVVEESIHPNSLDEQKSDMNTNGDKAAETELKEGLRESMATQQVKSGERDDHAEVGTQITLLSRL
ncbi:hypothetical protein LIPSTDRAFT_74204 [Lipomyces starkeyi NRRL Y-11557]|uniref:Uncharacterized protein n=1 Tax=Lipomyces starkeyi NRRL Y-11557 TaxID=675824 RepID=A0A1E3PZL0_LIPST|nr:hypothetical protein LIPSTDRAFT_74204 [Lipomyces starkeyi NRRL Y-11557]